MKKRIISIVLTFLIVASVACLTCVALVGCTQSSYSSLTKVSEYKDMKGGGDRIEVRCDGKINCLIDYNFYFSIQDKDDIDEIVNLLVNTRLEREDLPPAPGASGGYTLKVFQGEKTFTVSTNGVYVKDKRYVFATDDLFNKIKSLSDSKGASDDRYGLIYKFVDAQDLSDLSDLRLENLDPDGVLNAIESDFSDFGYQFLYSSDGETFESKKSLEYVFDSNFEEGQAVLFHYISKSDDGSYYISSASTITLFDKDEVWGFLASAMPRDLLKDLTNVLSGAFAEIFGPLVEGFLN